jgi:hypothetical protein
MQSEGGAAGPIHGALQTGALSTTFTVTLKKPFSAIESYYPP